MISQQDKVKENNFIININLYICFKSLNTEIRNISISIIKYLNYLFYKRIQEKFKYKNQKPFNLN